MRMQDRMRQLTDTLQGKATLLYNNGMPLTPYTNCLYYKLERIMERGICSYWCNNVYEAIVWRLDSPTIAQAMVCKHCLTGIIPSKKDQLPYNSYDEFVTLVHDDVDGFTPNLLCKSNNLFSIFLFMNYAIIYTN
jgi:hypothetical protein